MEILNAVDLLSALAQEHRLSIYRKLVQTGEAGLSVTEIAESLSCSGATLSFHLKNLKQAGLIRCRRDGRSLIYSANYALMDDLLRYLTDNCCAGEPCEVQTPKCACS